MDVMYAIDEAEGWTNPPSGDFLHQNQNLIIDTKHFSNTFKYALLESIPNLDEQTDGLMINGDNYHALNFLQSRYSACHQGKRRSQFQAAGCSADSGQAGSGVPALPAQK